jgi:site-specific recombinase XerD
VNELIQAAYALPPDMPAEQRVEIENLAERLAEILDGVADPKLGKPILDWIVSSRGTKAKNSINAFLSDLRAMAPLFRANNLMLVPARPAALSQYIDKIATAVLPMKATTIRRRMASVAMLHRAAGVDSPTRAQVVRDALTRHRRAKGTRTNQAAPLRTEDIKAMLNWIGKAPADLRDRAMILVAHDTAMRASELLSLKVEQVQRTDRGRGLVFLERSKTDGEGQGVFIAISKTALSAIEGWIASVGLAAGPLFRGFDLDGNLRDSALSRQSYDRIIKFRATAIGKGQGISAHSSRVGFAQDLLEKGASHLAVMQAGRWKSIGMVLHYGERIEAESSVATERFLDD